MTIDLSPYPTLLLLQPLLAERGRAIRSGLSQIQLNDCEQIARETKEITDGIKDAYKSGNVALALLMKILNREKLSQLSSKFNERCMGSYTPAPQAASQPAAQSANTQAFYATTPFQIMGAAQKLGHEAAPIVGAAAFVGLAAMAAYSLVRFGNAGPAQQLIRAL